MWTTLKPPMSIPNSIVGEQNRELMERRRISLSSSRSIAKRPESMVRTPITPLVNSGFAMILFLAGLENIPKELLEAAQIDGASGLQQLLYVKLPLIRYVILLWLLLNTLGCFNTFELIYALTGGGPGTTTTTMGIYVYNQGFRYFELGFGSAAGIILLLISLTIALIYVRLMRVEV